MPIRCASNEARQPSGYLRQPLVGTRLHPGDDIGTPAPRRQRARLPVAFDCQRSPAHVCAPDDVHMLVRLTSALLGYCMSPPMAFRTADAPAKYVLCTAQRSPLTHGRVLPLPGTITWRYWSRVLFEVNVTM